MQPKGYSEQQKDIYNIVLEAQLKSIEGIKPGAACKKIDSIAVHISQMLGMVNILIMDLDTHLV
ncbi:MAG: hypothetical protein CM1200mP31_3060 [Candidatus Neomarinimicrobiota bacterium]|nr:MAG: hypothetical protein CM1200mP31_3060 [Candidatus Neomarinimicrobiota bacterium]